jgi:hypothetical protein
MEATAAWLESLRKLAREENLNPEDAPDSPDDLRGQALEPPAPASTATVKPAKPVDPDLPAMADRKFGRRDGPTVQR